MPNAAAPTVAAETVVCRVTAATVHIFWPLRATLQATIPWPQDRCLECVASACGLGPHPQSALTVITYARDRPVLQSTFTVFGRQRVVVERECLASPDFALWHQRHQRAIAEFWEQAEEALGGYLLRRLRPLAWAIAMGVWVPVALDLVQQRPQGGWEALGATAGSVAIGYGARWWGRGLRRWLQRQILATGHRVSAWVLEQTLRHANLL